MDDVTGLSWMARRWVGRATVESSSAERCGWDVTTAPVAGPSRGPAGGWSPRRRHATPRLSCHRADINTFRAATPGRPALGAIGVPSQPTASIFQSPALCLANISRDHQAMSSIQSHSFWAQQQLGRPVRRHRKASLSGIEAQEL